MIEYLSSAEAQYLKRLVARMGEPELFSDRERNHLVAKLDRLGQWAIREDEARARLRGASQ